MSVQVCTDKNALKLLNSKKHINILNLQDAETWVYKIEQWICLFYFFLNPSKSVHILELRYQY